MICTDTNLSDFHGFVDEGEEPGLRDYACHAKACSHGPSSPNRHGP